jgi:cell division transport system permease protein
MSAFTRRREIAIMRLVGAGNTYILLPFLLESLVAGLLGILLSFASLAAIYRFVIDARLKVLIEALSWIGWPEVRMAWLGVAVVGVGLSIIPTLIATRKYLRT